MKHDKQDKGSTLLKCRVLPNNSYGKEKAGAIVEVDSKEYALVKHCLISLEDEKKLQETAALVPSKTEQARQEFAGYREMYAKQNEQRRKFEAERAAREARQNEEALKATASEE